MVDEGASPAAGEGAGAAFRRIFSAPPPTSPPPEDRPLGDLPEPDEGRQPPEAPPPQNYEWVRRMLVAGTGTLAEGVSFPSLQMTDFEATLIASGATRYAERQPDSIVAQIIDQSDLGAVVLGAGAYTVRNGIETYKAIAAWAQARAEAAAAAAKEAAREEIG